MADTLKNIPVEAHEWRDIYALTGIAVGTKIVVENTGTCDVYLAVQAAQPEPDHDNYNILKRTGDKLTNNLGDSGAWAFCNATDGELNVSVLNANGFSEAGASQVGSSKVIVQDSDADDITESNRFPVGDDQEAYDLQYDILTQLKITNMHLSFVTGQTITKKEVE